MAGKEYSIRYVVDVVDKATGAFTRMESAAKRCEGSFNRVRSVAAKGVGMNGITSVAGRVRNSVLDVGRSFPTMAASARGAISTTVASLNEVNGNMSKLKSNIASIGMMAIGGFGLMQGVKSAVDAGDAIYKMSQRMNISTKEAGYLKGMLGLAGVDANLFTRQLNMMDKTLTSGSKSAYEMNDYMAQFGVTMWSNNGTLLSAKDQLENLAYGFKKAEEAGAGEEFVMKTLGIRGMELIPLLRDYGDYKEALSHVKSPFDLDAKKSHELKLQMMELQIMSGKFGLAMANALMPIAEDVFPRVIEGLGNLATWMKDNKGIVEAGAKFMAYSAALVATTTVAKTLINTLKTLYSIVKAPIKLADKIGNGGKSFEGLSKGAARVSRIGGVFKGLGKMFMPLNAVFDAISLFSMKSGEEGKTIGGIAGHWAGMLGGAKLGATLGTAFGPIGTAIGGALGGVVGYAFGDKIGSVIGQLAQKFNMSALMQPFKEFGNDIATRVPMMGQAIVSGFSTLWSNVTQSASAAWATITSVVSSAIGTVGSIIDSIGSIASEAWSYACSAAEEAWSEITSAVEGAIDSIGSIIDSIGEIASSVWDAALSAAESCWDSIVSTVSDAVDTVIGYWNELEDALSHPIDTAINIVKNIATVTSDDTSAGESANGGVFSKPYLTWVAEAGYPEVIVPIDHSQNAIDLWTKAGQMLGVATGGSTPPPMQIMNGYQQPSGGNGGLTINIDGVNVSISNTADEQQIAYTVGRSIVNAMKKTLENRG